MSGWLDLTQLGLAPNQKHQALLGAPKIVHCGEPKFLSKPRGKVTCKSGLFGICAMICANRSVLMLIERPA
jgi:hypothetical protein